MKAPPMQNNPTDALEALDILHTFSLRGKSAGTQEDVDTHNGEMTEHMRLVATALTSSADREAALVAERDKARDALEAMGELADQRGKHAVSLFHELEAAQTELASLRAQVEVMRETVATKPQVPWSDWIKWSGGECPIPWAEDGDWGYIVDERHYFTIADQPAMWMIESWRHTEGFVAIRRYRYRLDRAALIKDK